MADTKIKDLTAYTTPLAADVIPLHKTSDDTDKKVTVGNLFLNVPANGLTVGTTQLRVVGGLVKIRAVAANNAILTIENPDGSTVLEMRADGDAAGLNTSVGTNSLMNNVCVPNISDPLSRGCYNSAFGYNALMSNVSGYYNTAIGMTALTANTTGALNTAVGAGALGGNTTGSSNTAIGYLAGQVSNLDNCVFIGNCAGCDETGNYKLFIDALDRGSEANGRSLSLIYGVFHAAVANQELTFNVGKMGFFGHAAAAQPLKASHNNWAAVSDVVAALVEIGIFDAA